MHVLTLMPSGKEGVFILILGMRILRLAVTLLGSVGVWM